MAEADAAQLHGGQWDVGEKANGGDHVSGRRPGDPAEVVASRGEHGHSDGRDRRGDGDEDEGGDGEEVGHGRYQRYPVEVDGGDGRG